MNDEIFDNPDFRQKPRPVGFEIAYRLDGDTLIIDQTRKIERVALGAVEQVRFFFQPNSISNKGYKTELRLKDGRTVTFGNLSWRSFVDLDRQEESYRRFTARVAEAVAKANPECRFIAGRSWIVWVIFAAVGFGAMVGMSTFAWLSWRSGQNSTALFALLLLGLAIWQIEPMVRLNRPRKLAPGQVPEALLP
jgi:hypothetical protein